MITRRMLVSLNTVRIKIRDKHPRIYEDLTNLFEELKRVETEKEQQNDN